ncbi:TspO/MBR family protein [Acidobacterium capsulatum ATCC 51196]|uniref:TspO/MBR family protein n=1 Tax=Acidobacterium capsulatum (strain ATCC 51196 / DSM 11244 / BCRC 80197 / JCM 7670 / NBRC 15755 / NCIMB 13165 / 161) TaxID=240015 RepID=C1F9K4_ACIC5|nr:TspO/MBR family protein [Acidobacterium capsulatum ATCC 51196]
MPEELTKRSPRLGALAVWLLVCYAVAALGTVPTTHAVATWYGSLAKPAHTPPNWVFGPVWTLLYTLMAVAVWLVWESPASYLRTRSVFRFWVQLGLNLLWSYLFFGGGHLLGGLIDILALWLMVLIVTVHFWHVRKWAGALMIPYLLWISFAAYLNWGVWQLNPGFVLP